MAAPRQTHRMALLGINLAILLIPQQRPRSQQVIVEPSHHNQMRMKLQVATMQA